MSTSWPGPTPGPSRWLPTASLLTPLAVALVCGVAVVGILLARQRSLSAEVARLRVEVRDGATRQRQLEGELAREHATLQQAEGDLESLRLQVDSVELQLDGVDYLTRQLQQELGMPQTGVTWEGAAAGSGGAGAHGGSGLESDRLRTAQERLARGLQELHGLVSIARERRLQVDAPDAIAAPPSLRLPANWPARGPITSGFGWRLFRGLPNYHTGIDIGLPIGTPVAATGDGLVLGSGWQPGYGWCVFVQHAEGYHSLYAHLADVTVRVGDVVAPGTAIGVSGSSGTSTGPHLHYEIWKDGRPLDPRPFMDGTGGVP